MVKEIDQLLCEGVGRFISKTLQKEGEGGDQVDVTCRDTLSLLVREAGGGDVKKYNCVHHIGGVASIVEHLYRVHVLAFEVLQIMEGGHKQLLK